MKINYTDPPLQSEQQLISKYPDDLYLILDDVLSSEDAYAMIFQDLLDMMKYGFEVAEKRHKIIRFKIHSNDNKYYSLIIPNFISNMILWRAFMDIGRQDVLDDSYIFNFRPFVMQQIVDYINDKILPIHPGDFYALNKTVDEIWYAIISISYAFTPLMGMGISNYDIMQMEERNPRLTELMNSDIDDTMQPKEIEDSLNDRIKEIVDIIINDEGYNNFKPMYAAGNVLNMNQSKEVWARIGLKADMSGHTIPIPINANFLMDGLNKASYIFINALSGRKAATFSKNKMSDPGAFSKRLNWICTPASILRKDYEECNSARPILYHIKDNQYLKCLNGRYYYDNGKLKKLDYKKDTHLIGQVLPFRDPCTCNSKDGICHICYGDLFDINSDLFSVGSLAATKTGEPLGQSVLSTKHNQETHSDQIDLPEELSNLFDLLSGELTLQENDNFEGDLYVILGDVLIEEGDDIELYYCSSFSIVDSDKNIIAHMSNNESISAFYLSETMVMRYKKLRDKTEPILISDLEDETIFAIQIANKEAMGALKQLRGILDSTNHGGATTIDELCQLFVDTLINIGIKYDFVHASTILRSIIRKKSNIEEFPEWGRNDDLEDYTILTIRGGLTFNPSPIVRICSGYLKKQLTTMDLFSMSGTSHLDPIFVDVLAKYID